MRYRLKIIPHTGNPVLIEGEMDDLLLEMGQHMESLPAGHGATFQIINIT